MRYILILVLLITLSSRCLFCSSSIEKNKAARLLSIQQEILDKLGLTSVPNVTRQNIPRIPPVLRLLQTAGLSSNAPIITDNLEEDNYHARTQRMIIFSEKAPRNIRDYPEKCCFFTFPGKVNRLKIFKATLDIYVRSRANATQSPASRNPQVKLYKRVFPITGGIPVRSLVRTKSIRAGKDDWYHFKIKSLVKEWRRDPHINLGLDIELEGDDSMTVVKEASDESKQPFLEVFTRDTGNRRRTKRNAGLNCDEQSNENRCCRFPLIIDFQSFGWDWIIAPKRFNANYCTGECQDIMLPMFPHAHLVRKANGMKTPCCSPNKMSPISMLYFDLNQKIMYEKVPAMVADTCGCA